MTLNASSNSPGFSYFVGVTDRVRRRFRNLNDDASSGGDGTLGRFRRDEYDGGRDPLAPVDAGRGVWCDDGFETDDDDDCRASDEDDDNVRSCGSGEPDRERGRSVRLFSLLVRSSCSNCRVSSVASKSLRDAAETPLRGMLGSAMVDLNARSFESVLSQYSSPLVFSSGVKAVG